MESVRKKVSERFCAVIFVTNWTWRKCAYCCLDTDNNLYHIVSCIYRTFPAVCKTLETSFFFFCIFNVYHRKFIDLKFDQFLIHHLGSRLFGLWFIHIRYWLVINGRMAKWLWIPFVCRSICKSLLIVKMRIEKRLTIQYIYLFLSACSGCWASFCTHTAHLTSHILIHQYVICTHLSDKRGQFDYTYSFWSSHTANTLAQIIDYFAVKSKRLLLLYPYIFRLYCRCCHCLLFAVLFFFTFFYSSLLLYLCAHLFLSLLVRIMKWNEKKRKKKKKILFTTFLTLFSAFVLYVCVVELFAFFLSLFSFFTSIRTWRAQIFALKL